MEFIRGIQNVSAADKGCFVTIGNFDGVHLGHQALLKTLVTEAAKADLPSLVVSFFPHTKSFFDSTDAWITLDSFKEKFIKLKKLNIRKLLYVNFDHCFSSVSFEAFVERILVNTLNIKGIVVGSNFYFGKNKQGSASSLEQLGKIKNFKVIVFPVVPYNSIALSASFIKDLLLKNELDRANQFLNEPYSILGKVIEGKKIGSMLGYPTINIPAQHRKLPLAGVYVVKVKLVCPEAFCKGVANVGYSPSYQVDEDVVRKIESYIFNFNENLYGKSVQIFFLKFLRCEKKFLTVAALKNQIAQDVHQARLYFQI